MDNPGDAQAPPPPWREELQHRLRRLSVGITSGLLAGFLIGGLGGRLAMLVLRLTSDPGLRGLKTDDDFTIGVFSSATVFLVGFATIVGALGGALYLVVRVWLPASRRAPWTGALAGVLGGAAIIHPGGVDFTRLEPLALAIALFVLVPGLFGVALSVLVERRLERATDAPGRLAWLAILGVVPILAVGTFGVLIVLILVAGFVAQQQSPALAGAARTRAGMALGRALLLAVGALATYDLVRDSAEIL